MTEEEFQEMITPKIDDFNYQKFQKKKRLERFYWLVKLILMVLIFNVVLMSLFILFLFAIGVIE